MTDEIIRKLMVQERTRFQKITRGYCFYEWNRSLKHALRRVARPVTRGTMGFGTERESEANAKCVCRVGTQSRKEERWHSRFFP